MRKFHLVRTADETGISGTGVVAEGVRFSDGRVAMRWCVPEMPSSVAVWDQVEDVIKIHGHEGLTAIHWIE